MSAHPTVAAILTAGLVAVALGTPAVAEDEAAKYPIVLTRAAHVGQKLRVKAEGSQEVESVPTFGGRRQAAQHRLVYVVLEADAEVVAVDADQQPVRIVYTISKCEHAIDGATRVIARKDAKLTAERRNDGQTHYTLDGRPLGPEESASLRVITRFDDEGLTHDQMAGEPGAKAPGESWPIDMETTIAALAGQGGQSVSADDVEGRITFWELTDRSGIPCLLVDTEFSVKDWLSEMTPGFDLESAEFTAMIRGLYPTDVTRPVMAESERVTIDAVMSGSPMGADMPMTVTLKVVQRVERETTPLETGSAVASVPGSGE